jgi:site-specific DNA-methyltransferase (adenine-specific)
VILGDCREVLPTLPALSIGVVMVDPPYSAEVHAGVRSGRKRDLLNGQGKTQFNPRVYDLGFAHLDPHDRRLLAAEYARLSRRWVAVFSDIESCHAWRIDLDAFGAKYIRTAIWDRIGGAPSFTGDRPSNPVECITLAHRKGRKVWNGGGKRGIYSHPIVANRMGQHGSRIHTTQKPETLMLDLIADFTMAGELVLDSHAGSGTTGIACLRLGRRAILIERDPTYAALCIDRMTAEEESSTLQARRGGQAVLFQCT